MPIYKFFSFKTLIGVNAVTTSVVSKL